MIMERVFDWLKTAKDDWRVGFLLIIAICTYAFEAGLYLVAVVFVHEFYNFIAGTSANTLGEFVWLYIGLFVVAFPYVLGRRLPTQAKDFDENRRRKTDSVS